MASRSTVKYKLYDRFLDPNGVSVLTMEDQQDAISGIIEDIKIGNNSNEVLEKTKILAEKLIEKGAQGLMQLMPQTAESLGVILGQPQGSAFLIYMI